MYNKVKGYRVMLNEKQSDIAEILHITSQAYSAKERGIRRFTDEEKLVLRDYFQNHFSDVTIDSLFFSQNKTK